MPLVVKRKVRQTWRDAVANRIGPSDPDGLAAFDALLAQGRPEFEAAYRVLEARGLLWRADEPGSPEPGAGPDEVPAV